MYDSIDTKSVPAHLLSGKIFNYKIIEIVNRENNLILIWSLFFVFLLTKSYQSKTQEHSSQRVLKVQ